MNEKIEYMEKQTVITRNTVPTVKVPKEYLGQSVVVMIQPIKDNEQ